MRPSENFSESLEKMLATKLSENLPEIPLLGLSIITTIQCRHCFALKVKQGSQQTRKRTMSMKDCSGL